MKTPQQKLVTSRDSKDICRAISYVFIQTLQTVVMVLNKCKYITYMYQFLHQDLWMSLFFSIAIFHRYAYLHFTQLMFGLVKLLYPNILVLPFLH